MIDAISLAVAVEVIGLLALPATFFFLRGLPAAAGLARPLGLLLATYPAWLLSSLHTARYTRVTVLLGVLLLAGAGGVARWRGWRIPSSSVPVWLAAGAVFWLSFALALALHTWSPDLWGVEKPMDTALINSINRAAWFPPPDPWLSGSSLNYYYYGHYVVAWLIRLTGSDPGIAVGSAVAVFFGLSASAMFSLTASLTALIDPRKSGRRALSAGLVATALAVLLGPLAAAAELVHAGPHLLAYRWWEPSRVIAHTANDFPAYSLLLGDLHAHVLAVPFALLCLAFSVQLAFHGPRRLTVGRPPRLRVAAIGELGVAALALGALWPTNSFNTPTAVVLGGGALAIWAATNGRWRSALVWLTGWVVTSILLFLPFVLHFHPATAGVGFVDRHPPLGRFATDEFLLYGTFALVLAPLLARRLHRLGPRRALGAIAAVSAVAALAATVRAAVPVLAVLCLAIVWYGVVEENASAADRCLWLIVAMGATTALVGDLVYVRDTFDSGADFRFNTVFKFGYQAWYLLAIASGAVLFLRPPRKGSPAMKAWLIALAAAVAAAATYPLVGAYSASHGFRGTPTLDGLRWLDQRSPDDLAAIRWLRQDISGTPTILEAVGDDFDPNAHGRVSVFTGLPTVLGWRGHELQWGHRTGSRWDDIRRIYANSGVSSARRLLGRYGVRYVFVGSLERRDYPRSALVRLRSLGRPVFSQGGTTVYRVR